MTESKDTPTLESQYQRLIGGRNFHYENFNKWLRFFYVLIGVLLTAYCTIRNSEKSNFYLEMLFAGVGYVISLACLLSAKGYYYWEYKWIELIHRFEKKVFGFKNSYMQVYSAFVSKSNHNKPAQICEGANISTSKVALAVTFFITFVWGSLIAYRLLDNYCGQLCPCCAIFIASISSLVITYILMIVGALLFPSDLRYIDEIQDDE